MSSTASPRGVAAPPSKAAGILYGLGLGGFVDGIVLHQILQWHHMVSHVEEPTDLGALQLNTLADGVFHVTTWALVLVASILTLVSWRRGRLAPSWSFHFGLVVAGWGIFNVVEGLINHQLLQLHHVRDDLGGPLAWDIGFLAFGVLLIAGGWLLHRHGVHRMSTHHPGS
ncbi:DUF2243 domain-containing protein [Lysobacter korlensis]|uniref:DUF2243 domain-containing protein n=1 Tax=Lysobacter korlensis TaxID=553636 RepID=A0ABV6RZD8_9GAMM